MRIKLPIGYMYISNNVNDKYSYNIMSFVFGYNGNNLGDVKINVKRIDEKIFNIHFVITKVYSTVYSSSTSETQESYNIMLGDVIRMKNSKSMTIEYIDRDGIIVNFEEYDMKRLDAERTIRKLKLKNIENENR
jgi:hypothetical protein